MQEVYGYIIFDNGVYEISCLHEIITDIKMYLSKKYFQLHKSEINDEEAFDEIISNLYTEMLKDDHFFEKNFSQLTQEYCDKRR